MEHFLPSWLDAFLMNHPRLMAAAVLSLALVASLLLITQTVHDVVLYAAF